MTIRKPWKVVGGTLAAAVALGSTAAVAQTGNDLPAPIDLDDVVTIDEVTDATIASLFSDSPTVTLDDSIASVSDDTDDESTDTADDDSADTPSDDTPSDDTPSVESADDSPDDSPDSDDSADDDSDDTPSVESADDSADDSPDDSPDSDDSN